MRHGRYSEGFARRDEDAISALYRDNGFRDVKVTLNAIDDYKGKQGDVAVTITIEEGPQYKVSDLNIEGLDRNDRDSIIAVLASQPGQPFSETNVALDRNHILEVYQSAGYPDVTFDYQRHRRTRRARDGAAVHRRRRRAAHRARRADHRPARRRAAAWWIPISC